MNDLRSKVLVWVKSFYKGFNWILLLGPLHACDTRKGPKAARSSSTERGRAVQSQHKCGKLTSPRTTHVLSGAQMMITKANIAGKFIITATQVGWALAPGVTLLSAKAGPVLGIFRALGFSGLGCLSSCLNP